MLLLDLVLVFHGKIMYDIGAVERWIGPEFGVKLPWSSHQVGPTCWVFLFFFVFFFCFFLFFGDDGFELLDAALCLRVRDPNRKHFGNSRI